jgi:CheY-like chemotaxis protein
MIAFRYKALIIDDCRETREFMKSRLEVLGHSYDIASSSAEAMEWLDVNDYSYFLINLNLPLRPGSRPSMRNGQKLCDHIHEMENYSNAAIIAVMNDYFELLSVLNQYNTSTEDLVANSYIPLDLLKKGDNLVREIQRIIVENDHAKRLLPFIWDDFNMACLNLLKISELTIKKKAMEAARQLPRL